MRYWLPRKGDRVVLSYQPGMAPYTLLRRLGVYPRDPAPLPGGNELWEARRPDGTRCQVAAGATWVPWEGRP